ncbi:MAG: ATP-binding protein [bacterium]|nr:ATP-binding protein [Candidatus Colousia faecequi]
MSDIIFKRKLYEKMLVWKKESAGETALLIEGARRVGKSTIVRQFAENEYRTHIFIDFANTDAADYDLFKDISDIDVFFTKLKLSKGKSLYERESVIVFDEVQKCPLARQAIKYLVADGRYDYIETGSLISIHQNVGDIVIPSEEESLTLYPMDYEEFRWALGDFDTIPMLREVLTKRQSLGDSLNRKLMRDFRLYMLVGGMPQAVAKYIKTRDLGMVDKVKRGILTLYEQDFHKLDKSEKLKALFKAIPSQLHKNATRFQKTKIIGDVKQDSVIGLIDMLEDSKTVNVAFRTDDPNVGMELTSDKTAFKMYLCDTGLFVTYAFWDKSFTENIIYQKLLNDKLEANLGYVFENAVAQALMSSGNKLYYYSWAAEGNHVYEVDFLLSKGFKLSPIEVKSSGYNTHRSLDEFCRKFSSRIRDRYLIYTKDLKCDNETLMIPIYMTGLL